MSDFETIKITDIKPATYNPRTITDENFNKLKQSLNQYGLVDPIVINLKNENTIIGGHQRYKALLDEHNTDKELYLIRLGDIGWVFDNLDLKVEDDTVEKLLNINLNQNNLMGEWDNEMLKGIFVDLKLNEVELDMTGFDDWEIDNISPLLSIDDYEDENEEKDNSNDESEDDNEDEGLDILSSLEKSDNKELVKESDTEEVLSKIDKLRKEQGTEKEVTVEEDTDESIEHQFKHKCPKCGHEWD